MRVEYDTFSTTNSWYNESLLTAVGHEYHLRLRNEYLIRGERLYFILGNVIIISYFVCLFFPI
jgi:hypothetical protein